MALSELSNILKRGRMEAREDTPIPRHGREVQQ